MFVIEVMNVLMSMNIQNLLEIQELFWCSGNRALARSHFFKFFDIVSQWLCLVVWGLVFSIPAMGPRVTSPSIEEP